MGNIATLKMNSNEVIERIPEFLKRYTTESIFINGISFPVSEIEFVKIDYENLTSIEIRYHNAIFYLSVNADVLYRVSIWDSSIHISEV